MTKRTLTDLIQQEQTAAPRRKVPTKADLEQTLEEVQSQLAEQAAQIQVLSDQLTQAQQERDSALTQLAQVQKEAQVLAQANAQLLQKSAPIVTKISSPPQAPQVVPKVAERKPMVLPAMNDDSSQVWLL